MAANGFEKLKVVIIDDNKHMRQLLHAMLAAFGVKHVHESANGKSGFIAVQTVKPDFVLTDFAMYPVNGVEFVRMVRSLHGPIAWVPIIMVTGHGERHYVETARDAGITELLCKPISPRQLYSRIVEVVERPRPFVKSHVFVGPDRRRRKLQGEHHRRRHSDLNDVEFREAALAEHQ
jgi:two-component system chemotaxis response regulator CheY